MNFLPNHNLAEFLKKQFFGEQRFVFVDKKEEEQIEEMMEQQPTDLEINEEGYLVEKNSENEGERKKIGLDVRDKIWEVDVDGYFGMGGTRGIETISENSTGSLEDLLRENADYVSALNGIKLKVEDFRDPLGYELLGGSDGLSVQTFPGIFGEKVSEKYEALLEIREGLNDQERGAFAMERFILQYRDEIAEERAEYLRNLEQEQQNILSKIADKIEAEKQELDEQVQDFKNICVDPDALKVELEAERSFEGDEKTGFFDYIEKKTKIADLIIKIKEGKFSDADVVEMSESIQEMQETVRDRREEIEALQNLQNNEEEQKEFIAELSKGVSEILAEYREGNSKVLNPDKAPKSEAEKKFVMQLIRFEERLEDTDNPINVGEIAFIDDVLKKVNQARKVSNKNSDILNIEVPVDKTSAELENELKIGIQGILNSPTPMNPKAKEYQEQNQADAQTLLSEVSDANLKKMALAAGQLDKDGKLTGDEEFLRKKWLVGKLKNLEVLKTRQEVIWQSLEEEMSFFGAKLQVQKYFRQIEISKKPSEVVNQLIADNHLEILPAEQFEAAYRKPGITNSYLVIEQTEYNPELPNYSGDDWMIYLDAAFYEKLEREEGDFERFKARIAHELGHREFEVEVRGKLEKAGIYQHEQWDGFKNQFNDLIKGKNVGGDEEGFGKNENVLNELYALSRENAVTPIVNQPLCQLVEKFSTAMFPMLDLKQKKLFGAIGETEEAEQKDENVPPENGDAATLPEDSEEVNTARSDKHQEAINGLLTNLQSLGLALKGFGVDIDVEEKEEEKDEGKDEKPKKKKSVQDISQLGSGASETLDQIMEKYKDALPYSVDQDFLENQSNVNQLNSQLGECKKFLDKAEAKLEDMRGGAAGYFENLLNNTKFLSVDDVFHIVTESWEFLQRRRDKNSQNSQAAVGQKLFEGLPYLDLLSGEYLSKMQSLELEEVNNYKNNFDNMSYEQIFPLLFAPKNADHFKAIIASITGKGYMRWDDPRIWTSLERYTFVRIPNREKAQDDIEYRNTWLKKIVGDIWDLDTWDGWQKSNDSALSSSLSGLEDRAHTLHALGGSAVLSQLDNILEESYKGNENVFDDKKNKTPLIQSHHYYKLLDYAFEKGKLSMEDKFHYLMEGVRSRALTVEDFRKIQSTRFGVLPILDFFYAKNNTYNDIIKLTEKITQNGGYPKGLHKLLFQAVLHDPQARDRLSKKVTSGLANEIDHDDWQALMAAVRSSQMRGLLKETASGQAKITEQSRINGMTSYSTFAKAQLPLIETMEQEGKTYDTANLIDSLASFVTYDAILMGRQGRKGNYARMDKAQLDNKPFPSGSTVREYQASMYGLIKSIFTEASADTTYIDQIFIKTEGLDEDEKEQMRNGGLENSVVQFEKKLRAILDQPDGINILKRALKSEYGNMASYMPEGYNLDCSLSVAW